MDGSAPKINVAPSLDNTTPEAIKPTVTEQAANNRLGYTDNKEEIVEHGDNEHVSESGKGGE